jgi:nucleotide-binding universal stress UspA family protein
MPPDDAPHFLVPTNFGKGSRIARRAALGWAVGARARVTLLHVLPPAPPEAEGLDAIALLHDVRGRREVAERRCRVEMDQLGQELHPELREFVDVRAEWRQGELAAEIVGFAREERVDAIVLGARRWRYPWRPTLAQRLSAQCDCRVVVVYEPGRAAVETTDHSPERSWFGRLLAACGWSGDRSTPELDALGG